MDDTSHQYQLYEAFHALKDTEFTGDVTDVKARLLDKLLAIETLSDRNATSAQLQQTSPLTAFPHYVAETLLNAGIRMQGGRNQSGILPGFALNIKGPNEHHSHQDVDPDPPPSTVLSLRLDHRGPLLFEFLARHFNCIIYEFTSVGTVDRFAPGDDKTPCFSMGFLRACDGIGTPVEYFVLGPARHAEPRPSSTPSPPAPFYDPQHPHPAILRHGKRARKGAKRDRELTEFDDSAAIELYASACRHRLDNFILAEADKIRKMSPKSNPKNRNAIMQDLKARLMTKPHTPDGVFMEYMELMQKELNNTEITRRMAEGKLGKGPVRIWRRVVSDDMEVQWKETVDGVVQGSDYQPKGKKAMGSAARNNVASSESKAMTPLVGSSSTTTPRPSGDMVDKASVDMDKDMDVDDGGESNFVDLGSKSDADEDDAGPSNGYQSFTMTLLQSLRPDLHEQHDEIAEILEAKQDIASDFASDVTLLGRKVVLEAGLQFKGRTDDGFLLSQIFPAGFQSRLPNVDLDTVRVPVAALDPELERLIETKDDTPRGKDVRSILSSVALSFLSVRHLGVHADEDNTSGNRSTSSPVDHTFWQDLSDSIRASSPSAPSPNIDTNSHPLTNFSKTTRAMLNDISSNFTNIWDGPLFDKIFHTFCNIILRLHLTPTKEEECRKREARQKQERDAKKEESTMKTSKSRKCWWKRLRSLQSDLAHCLRQPGSDKKAVRLNTITNALRGLAGSEPEILQLQLPGLEEQLEAMGRTSATTPVGDSLIDALCSRVEAEDQLCNFLLQEEQGAVEDRARDELKHASKPVDERVLRMGLCLLTDGASELWDTRYLVRTAYDKATQSPAAST
ncbi:hypothetical protein KI688_008321 [Linnemannia hyalina]|uniref:Uncharacterized protein n=1 Tax=Linnemannia hyalina TaxID=64524 RepID=A0A9P8BX11_9FUNG|nr:hypothetical protein KI688_008321 [Linnemannia hyalina]